MSRQLEKSIGWRITKAIFTVVAITGAGIFAHFIPEALSNCDWQHRQYISRDDMPRSFFAPPPESLADCNAGDVYVKYALVFVVYLLVTTMLYFVVRKVFTYIIYGKRS